MQKKSELRELSVTELRNLIREYQLEITGSWKMKKEDLIESIFIEVEEAWEMIDDEAIAEEVEVIEEKPEIEEQAKRGRTKTVLVFKNGELIKTIDGFIKTLKWATENNIANQGWVKRSLKRREETKPGFKYKEGGYFFWYDEQ